MALVTWLLPRKTCGPFPDWKTSAYTLPYPAGSRYGVSQGSCSTGSHQGPYQYAYDFVMPIGTFVAAARAGVVAEIRVGFRDGQSGESESNWVRVRHDDNTIAAYSHLTQNGALVRAGDRVEAGQLIALSGNTGNTGGLPQLHFHVSPCSKPVDCGTLPVTFRNTEANPEGLAPYRQYRALQSAKTAN
jgi:murein DD-endopeptidase MepM/ murein hydrolase activator NlpD